MRITMQICEIGMNNNASAGICCKGLGDSQILIWCLRAKPKVWTGYCG